MKEVQGKSTLVRVSEGSSYRESPVISYSIELQSSWIKKPGYICMKMLSLKGLQWTHPKDSGQFVYFIDISRIYKLSLYLIFICRLTGEFTLWERKVMREILFTSLRTWLDVGPDEWRLINKKMTFARQSRRGRYSASFKTVFSFVGHWEERTRAWKGDNFERV